MADLIAFNDFIRNNMQIAVELLPVESVYISQCYYMAIEIVNPAINVSPLFYDSAVYNLAADYLINFTPDQAGQTFFTDIRKKFDCMGFIGGVVTSASDSGTSESMAISEQFQHFTLADLQNLKTPYGRQYLSIAQRYGNIFGVS